MKSGDRNNGNINGGRDSKGRFAAGNPGRLPGARGNVRTSLRLFIESQLSNLPTWFRSLDNREKLEIFLKVLPFVAPKLTSIEYEPPTDPLPVPDKMEFDLSAFSDATLRELSDYIEKQTNKN